MKEDKKNVKWVIPRTIIWREMRKNTSLRVSQDAVYDLHNILVNTLQGVVEEGELIAKSRNERTIMSRHLPEATQKYRNRVFGGVVGNVVPVLQGAVDSIQHLVELLNPRQEKLEVIKDGRTADDTAGSGHQEG